MCWTWNHVLSHSYTERTLDFFFIGHEFCKRTQTHQNGWWWFGTIVLGYLNYHGYLISVWMILCCERVFSCIVLCLEIDNVDTGILLYWWAPCIYVKTLSVRWSSFLCSCSEKWTHILGKYNFIYQTILRQKDWIYLLETLFLCNITPPYHVLWYGTL